LEVLKVKNTMNSAFRRQRGSTLVIMAASMVFMVAMAAIAIDIVILYVVRSEAQRAADAAALAGAHQFVTSGFTSGTVGQGSVCDGSGTGLAQSAAIAAASQNVVGGQPGSLQASDIQCDFSRTVTMNGLVVPVNPSITVTVKRQNLPTFFSKIWSNATLNSVSAKSTAEAFNESGNAVPSLSTCLKPFLLRNESPDPTLPGPFIDVNDNGKILRPGLFPSGFIGDTITIKPAGNPGNPIAGDFDQLLFTDLPNVCPSGCLGSGSTYQKNIQCCNTDTYTCGSSNYQVDNANQPSPTDTSNGIQCMIHGSNSGNGADNIVTDPPPFQFIAGSNNPIISVRGGPVTTSDSLMTVALFNPPLTNPVQVVGFLQLFVKSVDVPTPGAIQAVIINVAGCGLQPPNRNPVAGGGVSPIPVRLVQPGGGN
jgi:hypothetical protein